MKNDERYKLRLRLEAIDTVYLPQIAYKARTLRELRALAEQFDERATDAERSEVSAMLENAEAHYKEYVAEYERLRAETRKRMAQLSRF